MIGEDNVLFSGTIPTSTTVYIPLPIREGRLGAHIAWKDATSSATITIEMTSYRGVALAVTGQAWEWEDSGLTISGPAGAAAGATSLNIENIRQLRARMKIVTAAATTIDILDGTAP